MGFAELVVIAIVGLLVIGPERLPETLKTAFVWFNRLKRVMSETRTEIEQQLGVDDIRRDIHNEEIMASLEAIKKAKEDGEETAREASESLTKVQQVIREDFEPEDEGLFGEQHAKHPPEAASADDSPHAAKNKEGD